MILMTTNEADEMVSLLSDKGITSRVLNMGSKNRSGRIVAVEYGHIPGRVQEFKFNTVDSLKAAFF